MKILLLGSGGREHALAWKISQSPHCERLFLAPGNAGTAELATNIDLAVTDFPAIKALVLREQIDMVVVGPEVPLVEGIYDFLREDPALAGLRIIGPSQEAARLEGSKAFAKAFMQRHRIPTAVYREFTTGQLEVGLQFLSQQHPPIVLKADGLAAGKGVLICESKLEAQREFRQMLGGKFGSSSQCVVVESFLRGREFSVFVITDGHSYQWLPAAKDYKRIGEGDTGLNTGGMGAVSPVPFLDETLMEKVRTRIVEPTIQGIREEGMNYRGFIFFGLIEVDGDPYTIEYNCRLGDPEAEVILPRLRSDLVELMASLDRGTLSEQAVELDDQAAATVILVSGGYPEAYEKGKVITGLDRVSGSMVFHAGTRRENEALLTNGGRVIALTSYGKDFRRAVKTSLENAGQVAFEGVYYRTDIGSDL